MPRQIGQGGLALLRHWEQGPKGGPALKPYRAPEGNMTIGYGHVIRPWEHFTEITEEQAGQLLLQDTVSSAASVERWVKVPLTQNQFDALTCFVFNAGAHSLLASTLLKELNAGNYNAVPDQLMRWDKMHDPHTGELVVVAGLEHRRAAEAELWSTNG